jgi:hypothetical protein
MVVDPGQIDLGELKVRALYICPPAVAEGDPVYQTGADNVDVADCQDINKMPCIGMVESKPTAATCWVVSQGLVFKLAWGLGAKQTYFVGPGTGIVIKALVPSVPGTVIQEIGYAKNSDTLMALVDRDFSRIT